MSDYCPLVEICVEDPAGVEAAITGGADRLELCAALALGGLTPTAAFVTQSLASARARGVAVHAMVRPRPGDFAYSPAEQALARDEACALLALGVDGLVFGAARDGRLDVDALEAWVMAVRREGRAVALTLHRVIDTVDDPVAAVAVAAGLGFDRILTSGGAAKAPDGLATIARMVAEAGGDPIIMAGSGVRADNAAALFAAGVREFHASAAASRADRDPRLAELDFTDGSRRITDAAVVAALRTMLDRQEEPAR